MQIGIWGGVVKIGRWGWGKDEGMMVVLGRRAKGVNEQKTFRSPHELLSVPASHALHIYNSNYITKFTYIHI